MKKYLAIALPFSANEYIETDNQNYAWYWASATSRRAATPHAVVMQSMAGNPTLVAYFKDGSDDVELTPYIRRQVQSQARAWLKG